MNARTVLMAALAVAAASCTTYSPSGFSPGTSAAQVEQSMGRPTGEYRNTDGSRTLEFARGPMGKHTYMLDFDAQDRLVKWEQVLNESTFFSLTPGMTSDQVLRRIGHPSDVRYLPRQEEQVWSYRYDTPFCLWFQVNLDKTNHLVGAGNGPDPLCPEGRSRD
ncbi:MAG TPA: hypothetical protein VN680_11780 [Burkholderiaceae bacterium]|jgi:hypothetical protein|nr:hypothetical protein [Burkholderiaceae bacterium]